MVLMSLTVKTLQYKEIKVEPKIQSTNQQV